MTEEDELWAELERADARFYRSEGRVAIVHCFSARLYGLRNYRKRLKEALAEDTKQ